MGANDDPTILTADKMYQSALGGLLGVNLRRRSLEVAKEEGAGRCPCGGPATLYSIDLIPTQGKVILLCDPCARKLVIRAAEAGG